MDVREKLVELIVEASHECDDFYDLWDMRQCAEEIASFMITHGVTVQEWISVTERLPEFTEEEIERYRFFGDTFFPEFNVMILGATQPTTLYCDGEKWYDEECHCYCVTHWQCLPQPPKGE